MTRITRVEVIDENGRSYVNWKEDNDITLSYQDDGRTLKVFVNTMKPKSPVEEAYKEVYGWYPPTTSSVSNYEDNRWRDFQAGYNASKVSETPQEPTKDKVSLYKRFEDEGAYGQIYFDDALKVVRCLLIDEAVIENEDHEYITFTLQKSLLEVPND